MHFTYKHTDKLKVKYGKDIHANTNHKKVRVAVLISDKEGFKTNGTTRDDSSHLIMIKGQFLKKTE